MAGHEKYLILGSNSFSGATFADYLAAAGHDVLATSRSDEAHPAFLPYKWQKRPGKCASSGSISITISKG
jgi:dTDP-glucose 4,6-dehydratase